MRFNNHFILAITAAVLVASQLQDSLFTTQDLSDDLLLSPLDTSTNDLEVSLFDNNNNNNNNDDDDMLFADPSGTDPSFDSSFQLAGAESCPSNDGHPPARLRSRDGYCPPNGQSSPSSLDGFVNNLGIFGDPGQVEEKLQNAAGASTDEKVDEQEPCPSYRPFHLCCESEGSKPYPLLYGTRRTLYKTMENCETVPLLPICVPPRKWEVCCEWIIYPTYTEQIQNDLAALTDRGNAEAVQAYREHLADYGHLTAPEGQNCITWGAVVKGKL